MVGSTAMHVAIFGIARLWPSTLHPKHPLYSFLDSSGRDGWLLPFFGGWVSVGVGVGAGVRFRKTAPLAVVRPDGVREHGGVENVEQKREGGGYNHDHDRARSRYIT